MLVQVAYAIGLAEPISIYINTFGTSNINMTDSEISEQVNHLFDLKPAAIIDRFNLKDPIYTPTASYGHMGRKSIETKLSIKNSNNNIEKNVVFFLGKNFRLYRRN